MANNLPTTKLNTALVLEKAKIRIDLVNKLLAKKKDGLAVQEFNYKLYINTGHSNSVESVAITPNGRCIVSGSSDTTIKLWDIESGKEVRIFEGHSDSVYSIAITPDGRYIISGSDDGTIKLLDIESGKEIAQFVSFNDEAWMASTPDGYYACSDNAMQYISFFDGNRRIDESDPIYKQRRKKNLGIKIGEIVDKYPNGVTQTRISEDYMPF